MLRNSVIRSNGKNASPAKRRRKKGEKENGVLDGRVRYFIEPRTETDTDEEH